MATNIEDIFNFLPVGLKNDLLSSFKEIERNFALGKWEPSELNGGKFAEATYTVLNGHLNGSNYPLRSTKPRNMLTACQALESYPTTQSRSVRILIPRVLCAVYEVRNNRGVGHSGSDVDPSHMDALLVLNMSKWVMAELVREFHSTTLPEAQQLVEYLIERDYPVIWRTDTTKRVLLAKETFKNRVLLLLYDEQAYIDESALFEWTDHSNLSAFRTNVLRPMHKVRLIEYDEPGKRVCISPLGAKFREERLPYNAA